MWKLYQYLYYRYYRWSIETSIDAEWTALLFVTQFVLFNLGSLDMMLVLLTGYGPSRLFGSEAGLLSFCILIGVVNYFLLFHRGKSQRIIAQFCGESPKRRMIGNIIVAILTIGTLALFFGLFLR